jgi:hypothetical protein
MKLPTAGRRDALRAPASTQELLRLRWSE